jgi:hypothetical protein
VADKPNEADKAEANEAKKAEADEANEAIVADEAADATDEKKLYRKKLVSCVSACDGTRVVSLGTNNLSVRVL